MTEHTAPPHASARTRKAAIRKAALRLVPLVATLYFINYLDRSNISFAKLRMGDDLGLSPTLYGFAAGIFFLGYLAFQLPSSLAVHRFGARCWLAIILLIWGVIASLTAFAPNTTVLVVLRFLLGASEAGLFPGVIAYLSRWFPPRERAQMFSWFLVAIPVSSVIGGPLSTTIMQFGDGFVGGLAGWRVMFLIEGLPAIVLAVVTWLCLTEQPADATWLTAQERACLEGELDAETSQKRSWTLKQAILNVRILGLGFILFGILYGLYTISFFLPTIVSGFSQRFGTSFSLVQTGLIVAIPFVVGTVVMILWSKHSDRTNERAWHVAIPMAIGGIAIPIATYLSSPFTAMIAITITTAGTLAALAVYWTMPSTFLFGAALAAGLGAVNTIGNLSGFVGPYITGWLTDLTGTDRAGMWVIGIVMVLAAIMAGALSAASKHDTSGSPADSARQTTRQNQAASSDASTGTRPA